VIAQRHDNLNGGNEVRPLRWFVVPLVTAVLMLLGATQPAIASGVTTLHFDELPFQPVNGLHFDGVTFHFMINGVASTDANYDSGGPGQQFYTQDPSLEGNAQGSLKVVFDTPTNLVQFGVALSTPNTLSPGVKVKLKDKRGNIISFTGMTTRPVDGDFFTESLFAYNADTPVKTMSLTFDGFAAARFVLDNLSYVNSSARSVQHLPTHGGRSWPRGNA
jgi:hypothetical protein